MITGAHFLLYSRDADADRQFLRDVLGFRGVDAGDGWLLFALPPAEIAVHPSSENFVQRHAEHELLGAVVGLYQPTHPTPLQPQSAPRSQAP